MSRLDDIKEQLGERFGSAWSAFQESSTYVSISDQYDNLSPIWQRVILYGSVSLVTLAVLAIPLSYYSASLESEAAFASRKTLVREFFRVKRDSGTLLDAPNAISGGELQSRAQAKLASLSLSPEQIGGVTPYDNANSQKPLGAVPRGALQQGAAVSIKTLNVRQIVDIGYALQSVDPAAKLVGMDIVASSVNSHYFDVVYRLVTFAMPVEVEPVNPAPGAAGKKNGAGGTR